MKTIRYLFFSTVLFFASCADLNEVPFSTLSPENYWNNEADVNNFVLGIYVPLKTPVQFEQHFFKLTVLPHPGMTSRVAADDRTFANFQYSPTNVSFSTIWRLMYMGINRANEALANIESAGLSEESTNMYLAEARFMRAFYYFHLVRLFGEIPLHLNATSSLASEQLNLPRSTIQDVYDVIVADLQFAEMHLLDQAQAGRASAGTAKTYLGEVYLTMAGYPLQQTDKFALAAEKLKEVVDNESAYGYGLVPDFADVFSVDNEMNEEMVFVIPSIQVAGAGSYLPFGASPPNHPGSANSSQYRWGLRRPYYNAFATSDTRRDVTLVVEYVNKDGRTITLGGPGAGVFTPNNGTGIIKYTDLNPPLVNSTHETDIPLMRYSEVLLMLAEALNENGDPELALPYLNRVRFRANVPDITDTNQESLQSIIRKERDFELMAEFKPVYDIRRWGTLQEVINISQDCIVAGTVYDSQLEFYPIPPQEIDRNPLLGLPAE